jgi:hypothetical protein
MSAAKVGSQSVRESSKRWARQAAMLLLVTLAAGCATTGSLTTDSPAQVKQDAVKARVLARWDLLIKHDLDAAYQFLSPASRDTMSLQSWKGRTRPLGWRKVEVDSIACEGEVCEVALRLTYDTRQIPGIVTPVREKWVIQDGQAWYVRGD